MASSIEFVDFVCRQISPAGDVSWRKMFGDYVVYLDGKPVFTVCGDTCYAKELPAVAALLPDAERGCPYDGAREHIIVDVGHGELAVRAPRHAAAGAVSAGQTARMAWPDGPSGPKPWRGVAEGRGAVGMAGGSPAAWFCPRSVGRSEIWAKSC